MHTFLKKDIKQRKELLLAKQKRAGQVKTGKVSETVLKRSVFKQIKRRRSEVMLHAEHGEDCTALQVAPDEMVVLSTDPITGTAQELGILSVHTTINDIVTSGAEAIGILVSILLPENAREIVLKRLMGEMESVCNQLNIEILGGHTEVSPIVKQPLLTITGVGKVKKGELITTKDLKAGDELVMTKWTGLEGTAILANDHMEELTTRYTKEFIAGAKEFLQEISVVKETHIAKKVGVSCMHDITEGGVYGALWEMAAASGIGFEVELERIPIRQETVEICEFYDLNPYQLMSGGCMLIGTSHGSKLVEALKQEGIPAAVIGRAIEGNDKVILREGERFYLEPTKSDELYKVQ